MVFWEKLGALPGKSTSGISKIFSILKEFDLTLMKIGKGSFIFILVLLLLSPFSLLKPPYSPKVTIIKRVTKTCNLFCNIATKWVKKRCCAVLPPTFKPVWQQIRLLPVLHPDLEISEGSRSSRPLDKGPGPTGPLPWIRHWLQVEKSYDRR